MSQLFGLTVKQKIFFLTGLLIPLLQANGQGLHVNWTRFIGLDSCCVYLHYAIPSSDGGIVFTGKADAVGSGDIPSAPYGGVIVGKMDSSKNISWLHVYGGEYGTGICQTPDGGYGVLAYTESTYGLVTGYHGNGDMWLLRLDSLGNFLWGKCFGSDSFDEEAFSIATTKDNGFILLGASNGAGEDVPFHLGVSEFEMDWFVVKTDNTGNKQWTRTLGGSNDEFWGGHGSIITADTNYYLVGTSNSTDYDCTDTSWHAGVNTLDDIYVLKLGSTGNVIWSKSYGGSSDDQAYNAVLDPNDSSIVITGLTGSHDYMVTTAYGSSDIWTLKIDKNGNVKWAKTFGSIYDDEGTSIAVIPGGGYVNLCGTNGVIGRSDNEIFVLDTLGNVTADTVFGGTNADGAASIFPFKQGYIATGTSKSILGFTEGNNFGTLGYGQRCNVSYLTCCPNPSIIPTLKNDIELIQLIPNPANDAVKIISPYKGNLIILNNIGQIVFSRQGMSQIEINTRDWPRGLYVVEWQAMGGEMIVKKLVIN